MAPPSQMHSCVRIQAVVDGNAVVLNCLATWMRLMSELMIDLIVVAAARSPLVRLSPFVSQRMDRNLKWPMGKLFEISL